MVELTNTIAQTLQPGQSITFDRTVLLSGCGKAECRDEYNPTATQLKGNGIYEVLFNANVASPTANTAVSLAVQVNGVTLPETTMFATSVAADNPNNVSAHRYIRKNCGSSATITVANTGSTPVRVLNPNLSIRRVS